MVYPGHRSTGCMRCKERRVKCDDTKPGCLRCAKFGATCPGYGVKQKKFMIINDTHKISVRARKSYAKQSEFLENDLDLDAASCHSRDGRLMKYKATGHCNLNSPAKISYAHSTIYPRLSGPSLIQGAVASFIASWGDPVRDVYWNLLESAAALYEDGSQHLKACIEAMSLFELSIQEASQGYNVRVNAVKRYGSALQLLNQNISELEERTTDQTILCIFLAILFERRLDTPQVGASSLGHFLAIMKLLRMRGMLQLSTLTGRQLIVLACISWHNMVMPLPQPIPCPISDEVCRSLSVYSNDRHFRSYRLIPLLNQGIVLRKNALSILYGIKPATTPVKRNIIRVNNTLLRTKKLDRDIMRWQNDLPSNWPGPQEVSANLVMNSMRTHLIFLDDLKVRCYQILAKLDRTTMNLEQINMSALHSRQMVDQICATMPYDFGLDTPKTRAVHVMEVSPPSPSGIDFFYHAMLSFPLLIAGMVDAGMSSVQSNSIMAVRKINSTAMRLAEPARNFPRVLVRIGPEIEPMLLCKICGTEIHYASQKCPGPPATASQYDMSLRQNLAKFRDHQRKSDAVDGEDEIAPDGDT